jgi:fatty-acyl-CoA synthase
VIGVEDEEFGQREAAAEDDLKAHVKANLASYKAPREIEFLDELPRNATGKVLKRELRERQAKSSA